MNEIITNIKKREKNIGIIGLGYVGLPLAIRFSEERFNVIGFDINQEKVNMLNSGNSFIKHITKKKISLRARNFDSDRLKVNVKSRNGAY